jgi:hypothetical protein
MSCCQKPGKPAALAPGAVRVGVRVRTERISTSPTLTPTPTPPVANAPASLGFHGKPPISLAFVLTLAAALAAGGCGDDGRGLQPISGTVTLKGKPVAEGILDFWPVKGSSAGAAYTRAGAVIRDGSYIIPKNQGLVPGRYKVSISWPDKHHKLGGDELPGPRSSRTSKDLIPPEYNLKTKLEVEVKKDRPNRFDFAIP